jgi:hypothetical protein
MSENFKLLVKIFFKCFKNNIQKASGLPSVLVDVILDMIIQHCPGQDVVNIRRAIFCHPEEYATCSTRWIAFSKETETQLDSLVRKMGCDMMVLNPTECRGYLDTLNKGE